MIKLPCPFCGSSRLEVVLYNRPCVVCRDCDSDGPSASRLKPDSDIAKASAEAVALWNKRKALPVQSDLLPVNGKSKHARAASEWGLQMADWFAGLIDPPPALSEYSRQSWGRCFDMLAENDKRAEDEIAKVCEWARAESFWSRNFLSPLKLREKKDGVSYYDRFLAHMKAAQPKRGTPTLAARGTPTL